MGLLPKVESLIRRMQITRLILAREGRSFLLGCCVCFALHRYHGFCSLLHSAGMKCLPQNKVSQAQGVVLHDWHAEILAIRAFNRFLLDECHALASSEKTTSELVRVRSQDERADANFQPFALNDGIRLYMYCSEAPCGDASMELTMAAQDDATPWEMPHTNIPSPTISNANEPVLHGRSYFSALGLVRRKPARPDAPPTLSKSCSDKLTLKQSTSLLSSITSLLISPRNCYINSLILPSSQYSEVACKRAFSSSGRLAPLAGKNQKWEDGYNFQPFRVITTGKEFAHSRRQELKKGEKILPSNISSFSTPRTTLAETLIGGTLQGRKQFSVKGASLASKRSTWTLALEIATMMAVPIIERCLKVESYSAVKESRLLEGRRRVKGDVRKMLGGWVRNVGGEDFGLKEVDAQHNTVHN